MANSTSIISPGLSSHTLAVLLVPLLLAAARCIYLVFFHPLSKYPGPMLSKICGINAGLAQLSGEATLKRHAWLQKYGPIVRVAPNEIIFSDLQSVKDIYGQTKEPCLKPAEFYKGFNVTPANSVFTSIDRHEHSRMRRQLAHSFSEHGVLAYENRIASHVDRFLSVIGSKMQPANIFDDAHHLFLDIVSHLSFDKSFDCLQGHLTGPATDGELCQNITAIKGFLPFIEYIPTKYVQDAVKTRGRLITFSKACIDDLKQRMVQGNEDDGSILKRMIEDIDPETGSQLSEHEVMENALISIAAGAGTSYATFLWFVYEMDRNPEIKGRVLAEIHEAFPSSDLIPKYKEIEKLSYLQRVFTEHLRMRGPTPTTLPRISPGKMIGSEFIPAGVRVSNLTYTGHRNPEIFPNPDRYVPDRWLKPTPEMKTMYRPFSTGSRVCIGMHLARVQILIAICALYLRFDVKVDLDITESDMHPLDRGTWAPRGKKLLVHLTPRSTA